MRKSALSLSTDERVIASSDILDKLLSTPQLAAARCVALFVDLGDEVAARDWIKPITELGVQVLLPRVAGDDMEFYDSADGELRRGSFGILEPVAELPIATSQIDVMVLPGVAFTPHGDRLGRGRGYYDRYLSRSDFRAFTIGVGFSHQLLAELPCEAHDRRVDMVLTPLVDSPIPAIMRRVIESAWGDADRLGCGVERLNSMGYSWVLLRYKMVLNRTPEANEQLDIETWISDCSRVLTSRNFVLRDSSGELLGEAISQWCTIDLKSRRPIDLTLSEINYPQFITPRRLDVELPRRLPQLDGVTHSATHLATHADIDFNNHVNTFRYIEMMLSMLPHATLAERGGLVVDVQFVHESYLGEELTIRYKAEREADDDSTAPRSLFDILRPDGSAALRALFHFGHA